MLKCRLTIFRLCLTQNEQNKVPFPKPAKYDPFQYELLLRTLVQEPEPVFGKFDPIPNAKTDTNNYGPFSTDNIGMNYGYPEASYEDRARLVAEHETYQKGGTFIFYPMTREFLLNCEHG